MAEAGGNSRADVLARVRGNLSVRGDEPGRRGLVQSRLRTPQRNLIPGRARQRPLELLKLFQSMLERSGATVCCMKSSDAVSDAIAAALRDRNLPLRVRAGSDSAFAALRTGNQMLELLAGPSDGSDAVGLSRAVVAAAETGTLFLVSGLDNPSTINFLPETHFVVVFRDDIAGSYEECWSKLRSLYGEGHMPRTVNLISGPSRTADIEQTIVMGAHGPRHLGVLIVEQRP